MIKRERKGRNFEPVWDSEFRRGTVHQYRLQKCFNVFRTQQHKTIKMIFTDLLIAINQQVDFFLRKTTISWFYNHFKMNSDIKLLLSSWMIGIKFDFLFLFYSEKQ